jgi:uncharacterized protein YqhQ
MLRYLKHLALTGTSWALSSSEDVLVGGQAVIEGVMMRSPQGYSVAVRRGDGSMRVIKGTLKHVGEKWPLFKLPFLRGMGVLGQALVLGIKALRFSAEQALQDNPATKNDSANKAQENPDQSLAVSPWFIAGNLVLALGINILLFIVLPLFLTGYVQQQFGFESSVLFSLVDGALRVAMFLGFLLIISRLPDMRRVFEYHGAEHKAVYNFEAREDLSVENARKYSTLHPRCGTSFLLVLAVVSILVFSIVHFDTISGKLLSRIILMPLVAGISYEIIRYSAKRPGSLLRLVTLPGLLLQRITTKEPDTPQLQTAIRALEEALTL